jgi:hypothetical protein
MKSKTQKKKFKKIKNKVIRDLKNKGQDPEKWETVLIIR